MESVLTCAPTVKLDCRKTWPPIQRLEATERADPTVRFDMVDTLEKKVAASLTVSVLRREVCFATPSAPRVETSVLKVA